MSPDVFPALWAGLPDPADARAPDGDRCDAVVTADGWEHVAERHLRPGREPWGEWLSPRLAAAAARTPAADADLRAALAVLEGDARRCLERPLALVYEAVGVPGTRPRPVALLLLPSGAVLILHRAGRRWRLATCYFPAAACRRRDPAGRWRAVVGALAGRYGELRPERGGLVPPSPGHLVFRAGGPAGRLHHRIRFVTAAEWGFDTGLPHAPWRGRLGPWPGDAVAPAATPRRRLRPRRRREEEDDV